MATAENCGGCRFWARAPCAARGHCRRRAPELGRFGRAMWPETDETAWCGAFVKLTPPITDGASAAEAAKEA